MELAGLEPGLWLRWPRGLEVFRIVETEATCSADDPRDRSQEDSALARVASGELRRLRTARTVDGHH